ncbi:hypothetical protein GCM10022384_46470 [Streptomyces marokkonensis]|uniref:Transposase Helix-turn-helix domain-containing protein n=1 Tax=Streptomyces marokkonensis TaxID=324855 RepID=A0ABP7R808_9ACTN
MSAVITALRRECADPVRKVRPWSLPREDRVLVVAAYGRTTPTMRRLAPLSGVSKSAADRIIDHRPPPAPRQPARPSRQPAWGNLSEPQGGKVTALVLSGGPGFPIADGPAHGIGAPAQTGVAAR